MSAAYLLAHLLWIIPPSGDPIQILASSEPHIYAGATALDDCKQARALKAAQAFIPEGPNQYRTIECVQLPFPVVVR